MNRRRSAACVAGDAPLAAHPAGLAPAATLTEVLVALGIVAVAVTVIVSMLQLGVRSVAAVHEQATAAQLARSQMEIVKSSPWPGPYPAVAAPAGYNVAVTLADGPVPSIQLVTVRVHHGQRALLTLQGYRGKR